jgi:isopenicillin N synthase-like dioxygenase
MISNIVSPVTLENGKQIDVAFLDTVDLERLEAGHPAEVDKLLKAAQSPGFFYLDLRNGSASKQLLQDLPEVYSISEKYFDQSQELKMKDFRADQSPLQDRG